MATHSSVLAWEIPWTEEPGGLWSMGSQSWTRLLTRQQQQRHPTLAQPGACFHCPEDMYSKSLQLCLTLRSQGLSPVRLLCPWNFPTKNTEMGYRFLLQGIFLARGSKLPLLYFVKQQVDSLQDILA